MAAVVGDEPIENCIIHPFELSERLCSACGNWFCETCLVTPWGTAKRALCITCAVGQSGLRRASGNAQVRTPKEIRKIEKQRKDAQRAAIRPVVVAPKPVVVQLAEPPQPVEELQAAVVEYALAKAQPPRRSLLRRLRPA